MPCWHSDMTPEDHARNEREIKQQWAHDAATARSMEAQ